MIGTTEPSAKAMAKLGLNSREAMCRGQIICVLCWLYLKIWAKYKGVLQEIFMGMGGGGDWPLWSASTARRYIPIQYMAEINLKLTHNCHKHARVYNMRPNSQDATRREHTRPKGCPVTDRRRNHRQPPQHWQPPDDYWRTNTNHHNIFKNPKEEHIVKAPFKNMKNSRIQY